MEGDEEAEDGSQRDEEEQVNGDEEKPMMNLLILTLTGKKTRNRTLMLPTSRMNKKTSLSMKMT